jgi:hypothetical protein
MMFTMKCPTCSAESKFSFVDNSYEGPRRCWKCHGAFLMKITDGTLVYCDPITEEEFKKLQEDNALKNKMNR